MGGAGSSGPQVLCLHVGPQAARHNRWAAVRLSATGGNLLRQLHAQRCHDGQGRGADDGSRARHARPCSAHKATGRAAGRGRQAGGCWHRCPVAPKGGRLTPLVSSMPCMRMTAMAEAHTMAAELDRPPPAQRVGVAQTRALGWHKRQQGGVGARPDGHVHSSRLHAHGDS